MIVNVLSVLVLLLFAALLIWAATRAWRSRRPYVRWPGLILSGLFALLFLALASLAVAGFVQMESRHSNPVASITVAGTPEQIARGSQIAWGCTDCHSPTRDLPLRGATRSLLAGGPPLGSIYGPNLTPGGPLKGWTDGEIVRAIREGIDKDGRGLMVMPSQVYRNFSDADVQALVAYLRSQPAVDNPQPARDLNAVAAMMVGAGMFPTSVQSPVASVVGPAAGATAEYGKYLVSVIGCRDCHGVNLDGVPFSSFAPPGPALKPFALGLNEAAFMGIFRAGLRADGSQVGEQMPWKILGNAMTDDDLRAVQAYLKALP